MGASPLFFVPTLNQVWGTVNTAVIEQKIREIAGRVATSEGLELVEVELRGGKSGTLRIVIDRISDDGSGVTHGDCETVSRQVSAILDVEDPIPHRYTLEVSSPGAERALKGERDFKRFVSKLAKVVLKTPLEDGQGSIRGKIASCEGGRVTLEIAGKGGVTRPVVIDLENVSRAQLALEW